MLCRRVAIQSCMGTDELPLTIPMFPRLGASGKFTSTGLMTSKRLYSHVISEDLFSHFERSKVLSDNLRARRCIIAEANVPIFRDANTAWPWKDDSVDWGQFKENTSLPLPTPSVNCVLLDHFAWSGGACGLQTTFQAKNLDEARSLHDQLCPLSAIMLALTAGSPCYKGYLVDTDSRWHVTNALVDDRSMEEILSKVCIKKPPIICTNPDCVDYRAEWKRTRLLHRCGGPSVPYMLAIMIISLKDTNPIALGMQRLGPYSKKPEWIRTSLNSSRIC